ncbi:hypothetical protein RvY_12821 [Ramazzottius varieornatus]|uniref:Uncharacterized protein n=1 Tax=Ramazzottius varieornatus TaxID=947166 RepID=A0A1D1VR79_RAMVA|nr:hypothetical protein RvY_12821 [Ramazzottius varieornatus]
MNTRFGTVRTEYGSLTLNVPGGFNPESSIWTSPIPEEDSRIATVVIEAEVAGDATRECWIQVRLLELSDSYMGLSTGSPE